ncbi:hypothetical protein [Pseudomonas izuensis]|uniref:hypothetical protein n=1 Tax=Pseudomonas izuensis TaxID=2684212 RepID=UPI001356B0D0|nr:hypothetical protein [Pseudomonas izuensis]
MFISKTSSSLIAIHGTNSQAKPEPLAISSRQGVTLSEAREQAISNSRFFEAGASLSLLNQPGKVSDVFDQQALQLACVLRQGMSEKGLAGRARAYYQGKEQSLSDVLQQIVIDPFAADSGWLGRHTSSEPEPLQWLLETLSTPFQGRLDGTGKQTYTELFTKICAVAVFGDTIWQLMNPQEDDRQPQMYALHKHSNIAAFTALLKEAGLDEQADAFMQRVKEFSSRTRTPAFDNPISRARSQNTSSANEDKGGCDLNNNVIARQPFTLSQAEMGNMPQAYAELGLHQMLGQFCVAPDTTLNPWQPFGTFALESNLNGLPSAGSQSGNMCDLLLSLNVLSPQSIYGNENVALPAGLGLAAMLNAGGYHTFVETVPLAEAAANNRRYFPGNVAAASYGDLYQRIEKATQYYSPEACEQIGALLQAHAHTLEALHQQHPDLQPQTMDAMFYATPSQMENWRDS